MALSFQKVFGLFAQTPSLEAPPVAAYIQELPGLVNLVAL